MPMIVALVVCAAQEDIESLVAQLGHEDPEIREAATQKLEGLGEDVLEQLQLRIAKSEGEVRARLEQIVRNIDWPLRRRRLDGYLDATWGKKEWIQAVKVEEVEDQRIRAMFPRTRAYRVDVTYVAGHPKAQGALSSNHEFLIRNFDDRVYQVFSPEDILKLAQEEGVTLAGEADVRAFFNIAVGTLASLKVRLDRKGQWLIENECSGEPGYYLYRLTLSDRGEPRAIEDLGFHAYRK